MTSTRPYPSLLRPATKMVKHRGLVGYLAALGFLSGVTAIGLAVSDQLMRGLWRPALRELDIAEAGVFLAGAVLAAFCLVGLVLVTPGARRRLWLSILIAGVVGTGGLAMTAGLYLMMYRTSGLILCGCTGLVGGAVLTGGGVLSAVIHQRSAASAAA
jgi:hypothetical protein